MKRKEEKRLLLCLLLWPFSNTLRTFFLQKIKRTTKKTDMQQQWEFFSFSPSPH